MRILWTLLLWSLLVASPFAVMFAVNAGKGPASHGLDTRCSRHCHDNGCSHTRDRYDWSKSGPKLARAVYFANIRALRSTPLGYQNTNLLVYVALAPLLAGALLLFVLWPRAPWPPGRVAWVGLATLGLGVGGCVAYTAVHAATVASWRSAYWFCTDFCIHGANLLGATYEEFNFVLFVLGFPFTLVALVSAATTKLVVRRLESAAAPP